MRIRTLSRTFAKEKGNEKNMNGEKHAFHPNNKQKERLFYLSDRYLFHKFGEITSCKYYFCNVSPKQLPHGASPETSLCPCRRKRRIMKQKTNIQYNHF